jgi:hypothetical protein
MDASHLAKTATVFWLPPANDSQGQQRELLSQAGLAPHWCDWHHLLEGMEPIDFFGPQMDVMKRIATAIREALSSPDFATRFGRRLRKALHAPLPRKNVLAQLGERFGRNGDAEVVALLDEHLLRPLCGGT